jgi:5'-nucleotidase
VTILVTNDDGIHAEGLKVLAETLKELGEVYIVAPDRQRSAVGLCITLDRPLRAKNIGDKAYSVDGTPADCVTLAIHKLMDATPDIIVSGVNDGQNLGYDIYHSGTVGAAFVGTMFGIPSMAISVANKEFTQFKRHDEVYYETAAQVALKITKTVTEHKLPRGVLLNINVPNLPLSEVNGMEITRHCNATYSIEIHHRLDPRGGEYYWVGGDFSGERDNPETDLDALWRDKVSVTPLRLDITDHSLMQELSNWIKL